VRQQLVVHEPRAVHRLDHPADRLAIHRHPAGQPIQAVSIRGPREAIDELTPIGDETHINAFATQIQTNMQHEHSSFPGTTTRQGVRSSPPRTVTAGRFSVSDGRPRGSSRARLPMLFDLEGRPPSRTAYGAGGPAFIAFPSDNANAIGVDSCFHERRSILHWQYLGAALTVAWITVLALARQSGHLVDTSSRVLAARASRDRQADPARAGARSGEQRGALARRARIPVAGKQRSH
jgi:hypothetical protein